jgi:hypothetical protein
VRLFPFPLLVTAIATSAFSAALWAVTIAGKWPAGALADTRTGAGVMSVIAAIFWAARGLRRRDAREDVYIHTIANVTRPAAPVRRPSPSGPLRRVQ